MREEEFKNLTVTKGGIYFFAVAVRKDEKNDIRFFLFLCLFCVFVINLFVDKSRTDKSDMSKVISNLNVMM